jgi:hypothetical protein
MTTAKRNYKKEYKDYHGKPEQIAARSQRNQARAKLGLAVGDPREADHKNRSPKAEATEKTISEPLPGARTARRAANECRWLTQRPGYQERAGHFSG